MCKQSRRKENGLEWPVGEPGSQMQEQETGWSQAARGAARGRLSETADSPNTAVKGFTQGGRRSQS